MSGLVWAPAASAHPSLLQSDPAPGVVAKRTPGEITLSFTEPTEPSGSAVRIKRLDGRVAPTGRPVASERNAKLTAPVEGDLTGGVYEVKWSVLGTDGHQVGGDFRFGVAGAGGAPPRGIEQLGAPAGAGNRAGGTSSSTDGVGTVFFRWAGLLAAALMLGGWLLARRVRAVGTPPPEPWAARLAAWAWVVALATAIESTIAVAAAGADGALDAGLLTSTETGVLALLRVGVLALLGAAALRLRRTELLGPAGALALATHALDGHTAAVTDDRLLVWIESLAHVEAAATWAGGLVALVLWAWLGRAPVRPLVRAFAPVAGIAMVVLAIAGALTAVREVDSWMFLRWSGYGRVVIVKSLLLLCVLALAGWIAWHGRRARSDDTPAGPAGGTSPTPAVASSGAAAGALLPRALRVEAVAALGVLALAATLAGLVQGRGQPKYAQRGNLFTGAALATAATEGGPLQISVAPARPGMNTISAIPKALREDRLPPQPRSIEVRLGCDCAREDRRVRLRRNAAGVWSARVDLPDEGSWFAYASVNGKRATAPVGVTVDDPHEGGPEPLVIRSTVDLTGAQAERCRAFIQGLAIGVGRVNAGGGVDGGRKVALDVRDDGGDPARAATLSRAGDPEILAPCGPGGAGGIRAVPDAMALAGDPLTPSTAAPVGGTTRSEGTRVAQATAHPAGATSPDLSAPAASRERNRKVFRLALDPYAEGVGIGRFLNQIGLRNAAGTPKRVAVVVTDAAGEQRLAGLRGELQQYGITPDRLPADAAESVTSLRRITAPKRYLATLLDGDPTRVAAALRELGGDDGRVLTSLMFVGPRLASEPFMLAAGPLGRLGVLRIASEVTSDSADGLAYASTVGTIYRGDQARLSGLRGYVTGLTIAEALRDGADTGDMVRRLRSPRRYTDALTIPWREDAPARGAQGFAIYAPNFLPANLMPEQVGGMAFSGRFFQKGSWSRVAPFIYGPGIEAPRSSAPTG